MEHVLIMNHLFIDMTLKEIVDLFLYIDKRKNLSESSIGKIIFSDNSYLICVFTTFDFDKNDVRKLIKEVKNFILENSKKDYEKGSRDGKNICYNNNG